MFETGIIDPSDLQKYLKNRNGGARPVFVYKHRLHDIISIRQDNDGNFFYINDSKDA